MTRLVGRSAGGVLDWAVRPTGPGLNPRPRRIAVTPVLLLIRGSGLKCIVGPVESWGVASFENDAAGEWFLLVEEAPEPGAVMASAIDEVLSAAEFLDVDLCCGAIAAAELCACCAGQLPDRLPDNVYGWVRRILTSRTPTRSTWRLRPSVGCAMRASCATLGRPRETVLSGWLKWMVS